MKQLLDPEGRQSLEWKFSLTEVVDLAVALWVTPQNQKVLLTQEDIVVDFPAILKSSWDASIV